MPYEPSFHNPYNFIPAPPRDQVRGELGDRLPTYQDRYRPDYFSGRIVVEMTTETPLILPDASDALDVGNGHKSYPIRMAQGAPFVPPTTLKGMLRAAYEAVTNSRLSVFQGHDKRLAYRMAAGEGLGLVPARIEGDQIRLLLGTTTGLPRWDLQKRRWIVPENLMYAAWLFQYDPATGGVDAHAERYPNGTLPPHRGHVDAIVERIRRGPFQDWRVREIVPHGQPLHGVHLPSRPWRQHVPVPNVQMQSIEGYVCRTNRNIDRKHDERVFFDTGGRRITIPLTQEHQDAWRDLIKNYQITHAEEIREGQPGPPALRNSVWSRQVTGGDPEAELSDGTLCYASVEGAPGAYWVRALYPVMISRKLLDSAPAELLPTKLQPATRLDDLSPADRVFGWISQGRARTGAYRGNIRIGPVKCGSPDAVETFDGPGVPLAILGQPKPQQARFYAAETTNGQALQRCETSETYRRGRGLRGRKVYPHHRGLPSDYWRNPLEDRTQRLTHGRFQEYRRPDHIDEHGQDQTRDNQNRSIQAWVKTGTVFTFPLDVTNLSRVELGALVWLLSLGEGRFHHLGGAKPLGFGSVRLRITQLDVSEGLALQEFYSGLDDDGRTRGTRLADGDIEKLRGAFIREVETAYGLPFDQVPFIAAFLRAAEGFEDGLPLHYPRTRSHHGPTPPDPKGENFTWFMANQRTNQEPWRPLSLPDLETDQGLPLFDA